MDRNNRFRTSIKTPGLFTYTCCSSLHTVKMKALQEENHHPQQHELNTSFVSRKTSNQINNNRLQAIGKDSLTSRRASQISVCHDALAMPLRLLLPLLLVLFCSLVSPGSAAPLPDDAPTTAADNTLEMLVLPTRRGSNMPSIVVVSGGRRGGSSSSTPPGSDILNYYLPVIMAEMTPPKSTRVPSVIRVSCRGGFKEDPSGGCRPTFVPTPFYPRNTRPNRHAGVASILPVIRTVPRVPRPQPLTQRDLIRQFNTSRGRPSFFGRSLTNGGRATDALATPSEPSSGPSTYRNGAPSVSLVYDSPESGTTTTTTSTTTPPPTTTPDCDD